MTARIFAILAAVFLVGAVGIAALTPFGYMLGEGLHDMDKSVLGWLQGHSTAWVWNWFERPLLIRPLWLVPASLGVVFAGLATTFSLGKASPSHRRRS